LFNRHFFLPFICLVFFTTLTKGQKMTNRVDARGRRHGEWIIQLYDVNRKSTYLTSSPAEYRKITYSHGKITGPFTDFYKNGNIAKNGILLSENPDVYESVLSKFYEDGVVEEKIFYSQGILNWKKTIVLLDSIVHSYQVAYGRNHSYYLNSVKSLLRIYSQENMARDELKMEILITEMLSCIEKQNGLNSNAYIDGLRQYAEFKTNCGNLDGAISTLKTALALIRDSDQERRLLLAECLQTMGETYQIMEDYPKSEKALLEALKVVEELEGRNTSLYSGVLRILFHVYLDIGQVVKAERLAFEVLAIESTLGKQSNAYFWSLENIARISADLGNLKLADSIYRYNLKTIGYNRHYSQFLYDHKRYAEADSLMRNGIKRLIASTIKNFSFFTEEQRESYYNSNIEFRLNIFNSFACDYARYNESVLEDMYNLRLSTKAILLNNSAKWKQQIRQSGDMRLLNMYLEWEDINQLLASSAGEEVDADFLTQKKDNLEKTLTRRSHLFSRAIDSDNFSWKDIRQQLNDGEAAIEIVRYFKRGIVRYNSNKDSLKVPSFGRTDSIFYAALVLRKSDVFPRMILMKDGNEMEGRFFQNYKNCIRLNVNDNFSFAKYFERISPLLGGIKKIYFSSDGVYHMINLNTLKNPASAKFLIDEIEIIPVTSTKDIVRKDIDEEGNKYAILYGISKFSSAPLHADPLNSRDITLNTLPGAKAEVENVGEILRKHGWEVELALDDNATEAGLKDSFKPKILHIATHGFLSAGADKKNILSNKVMKRCGLVLNQSKSSEQHNNNEDGILTAYEAMNLNLDNTSLVVLSACETGIGDFNNSEGVYGMQRAFRVAGAKTVIMSLWKIPDDETRTLMTSFYLRWLGGMTKYQAFRQAQIELKDKVESPAIWGGFVMVGE
jgi:hypothetical protein